MNFQTVSKCLAAFALLVTTMNATEYAIAECACPGSTGCSTSCASGQSCCPGCAEFSSVCICCESGETCRIGEDGGFGTAECIDPGA